MQAHRAWWFNSHFSGWLALFNRYANGVRECGRDVDFAGTLTPLALRLNNSVNSKTKL